MINMNNEEKEKLKEEAIERAREDIERKREAHERARERQSHEDRDPDLHHDRRRLDREIRRGRDHLKNITIRGIDTAAYEDFSSKIRDLDMTLGKAVSKMMTDVVQDFNGAFPRLSAKRSLRSEKIPEESIKYHDYLEIGASDLVDADTRFFFAYIKELIFKADITRDIFEKYIGRVSYCDYVEIPLVVPKLIALAKTKGCKEVVTYDPSKPRPSSESE